MFFSDHVKATFPKLAKLQGCLALYNQDLLAIEVETVVKEKFSLVGCICLCLLGLLPSNPFS